MYALNTKDLKDNVAKAYSKPMSKNITESGKYNVIIDCAIWTDFSGWKGLELHLLDENENKARIALTYESNQGERFFGADQLDAIMVCSSVKSLTSAPDSYVMWSRAEQSFTEQDVSGCPELKGKELTLLLQRQLDAYEGQNGVKETDGLRIYGVYQNKTELSANEILDRVTIAEDIKESEANLEKSPLFITKRHKNLKGAKPVAGGSYVNNKPNENNDLDDDLPF